MLHASLPPKVRVIVRLSLLAVLSGVGRAYGQATEGSIVGTVRDQQQAVLPGATVTVTNEATGLARTLVSDATGNYEASHLPIGSYSVAAELAGFKRTTVTGVHLAIKSRPRTRC
ncbi:MAG: hypothetical protein DMG07_08845 [Acidobacteria bacterium]|nr:MAG: hypothetical protein DMG07_08845 [Acidobacteriota bacterium]